LRPTLRSRSALWALLGAAWALAACPDPGGRCQVDADCAAGPAGSFCAEGVCQGLPLATVEAPQRTCARSGAASLRVHVTRAHGGAAAATARFEAGALRGTAVREEGGSLRLDVPCSFGAQKSEGPAALWVFVADDLGHEAKLPAALQVDDQGPALAVDPASLPASALRGTKVALRVTASDLSGVASVRFSVAGGAAHDAVVQADGSYRAEVDTGEVGISAERAEVAFTGVDLRGNGAQVAASFGLTRLKWKSQAADGAAAVGLALSADSVVLSTTDQSLTKAARTNGALSFGSALTSTFAGNLLIDGAFAYSALRDARVCKLGLDGTLRWCCEASGPIGGSLALGLYPTSVAGAAPVPTLFFTIGVAGGVGSRLVAAQEDLGVCARHATQPLSQMGLGTPSLAADGTTWLAGHGLIVSARFDGFSWSTPQTFTRSTFYEGQPALAPAAGGGLRLVAGNAHGLIESLLFPAPDPGGHQPDPAVGFSSTPVAGPPTSSAPVVAADGTVLVSLPSNTSVAALAPDGSLRWKATLPAQSRPAPVLGEGGLVFTAADDGTVTALDLATGAKVWSWSAGAAIGAPLALGCDGILYGATDTGLVFALVSGSSGPAGPWPREGHDPRGTGDGSRAVSAGPACAE
jgi:hypothetical protein